MSVNYEERRTYHQSQDKASNIVSNLRGDVVAKLLQRGEEAFQLAQLASPTGGRQLLVCQRGGGGRGRPVAVPLRWRWYCIQGWWGMMIPVGHWRGKDRGRLMDNSYKFSLRT